jgi:2-oxoglutarate ferredoxin oxidoreductase subunit beta
MNTYGFHTIHGRATAVATGLKSMCRDLCVWVITGDGDALSIGTNHLVHCLRRNVNVNILLVNNQVYGLTKGQFSPTSQKGQVTKTTPEGATHQPLNPLSLALAAGASFVARAVDKDPQHLATVLKQAYEHEGCSFVEIYQDCNIFNQGSFDAFSLKTNRSEHTIALQDGQAMHFGSEGQWGLEVRDGAFCRVPVSEDTDICCHRVTDGVAAMRLAQLTFPEFPVPLGVYYQQQREMLDLSAEVQKTADDLPGLFRSKASWKQG